MRTRPCEDENAPWLCCTPQEWKRQRLKQSLSSVVGGDWGEDTSSEAGGEALTVLRVADFSGISVRVDNRTQRLVQHSKIPHRLVSERSLLLEKSGGGEKQSVGRVVRPGRLMFRAICSNFIAKLEVASRHDAAFLNYAFSMLYDSGANQPHIRQTTGIQNLSVTHYLNTKLAFPETHEQRRIAHYLDNACRTVDGAIDAKRKQLKTLAELRKTIIHKAVTRGLDDSVEMKPSGVDWLGEIPAHWNAPRLKDIADIRYGLGQPPAESDDGIPMIRATNVNAGRIVDRDLLCIDEDDLPLGRNPYLKANEIIVVRSGAYTGDSAIIPTEYAGAVAGYDMVVTVRKAAPEFVAYTLLSYYVLNAQILLLTLRAAQPHLNAEQLGSVRLLVPDSRNEQKAIATHIAHKLAGVDRVHKSLTDQIQALRDYRKSLIHECVTGKRRITDADIQKVKQHV